MSDMESTGGGAVGVGGTTQDGTVDVRGRPAVASRTGKWKACVFLLGYEAFERMAFYGVASNLVVYLTSKLHQDTVSSVRSVSNWSGAVWITPIAGAYIADAYLGRFWTFTASAVIYVLGMALLTFTVSIKSMRPSCANGVCNNATPLQLGFFFGSLYIIALGAGGTKPNISTFGADQFDELNSDERQLKAPFFNWWMFSSFLGGLLATMCLVYIQENLGWGMGYAIPTVGLLVSLLIFFAGIPCYRYRPVKAGENPMWGMVRVWVKAFANRGVMLPEDPKELYELDHQCYVMSGRRQVHHTTNFRFLDKAAVRGNASGDESKPCTVTQVEETKMVLGMTLIWFTTLIPCTIFSQVNTLFVKQGTTLNRTIARGFQIPAASLGSFITISMLLAVPIYDRVFVPYMQRRTGNPRGITLLQRIGVGLVFHILVTTVACAVEAKRIHTIKVHGLTKSPNQVVPMSIFWLLPQYILLGIGDVFNAIGVLEFFYDQAPDDMRSLGTTFFTSGIGMGNFLNSLLITMVVRITSSGGGKSWVRDNLNDSRLDYYYAFLLALSVANLAFFLYLSGRYQYKEEKVEHLVVSHKVKSSVQMAEGKSAVTDDSLYSAPNDLKV